MQSNPDLLNDVPRDDLQKNKPNETNDSLSAIQKYEDEWVMLFGTNKIENLTELAQKGHLRASRFRSVCWRVLLEVLSTQPGHWLSQLRHTRSQYRNFKSQKISDPHKNERHEDDPLSQNSTSIWNQHFCDLELRAVIRQDVVRTFPGIEFFRKPHIQDLMVDILFIYARVHPKMCYRQGMHEILAPLLFVLHCDQQAMLHTREQGPVGEIIQEVLNPTQLEEDGYTLFERIMTGIEFCYVIKDLEPTETGYFPSSQMSPSKTASASQSQNEVIQRLQYIKENLLQQFDLDLTLHLDNLDIPFPVFGIRWLRLLFGREFPLQDLLVLWDVIFSKGQDFEFINYVVVAMLIAIRTQLIRSDYSNCLSYLMRYPPVMDIMYIVDYALYLKDPQLRSPPSTIPSQIQTNEVENIIMNAESKLYSQNRDQKREVSKRISKFQNGAIPRTESESAIVEGFKLHDPEVLRVELNHAHNIMALCQLKLTQYQKILQQSLPVPSNEIQLVLDGMCELCHLLRSRHYNQVMPVDVEPALEAGESKINQPSTPPPKNMKIALKPMTQFRVAPNHSIIDEYKQEKLLKVFSEISGEHGASIPGAPLPDPLSCIKETPEYDFDLSNLCEAVKILNVNNVKM